MTGNHVIVDADLCKSCRVCVETCPNHCLEIGSEINALGYQAVRFDSEKCTACGLCFYVCPEPGVLTVIKGDVK
ncbi:MAG: 4Fe-4S binding protein [Spirochaetales bacterium]|uniref:4Fe-4S binding protein n=1 Tax=Candidatus Thalassospirochaeta sargassi TaxID=3119039 RepID=A0AAJ1IFC9_9SPIO|nr:4Fe-4S binding protein [Spirochaetales bacterium]